MTNSLFFVLLTAAFITDGNTENYGHPATKGQFKYAASIWHAGHRICNGAVITVRHILTAGHCVHQKKIIDFRVLVGIVGIIVTSSTTWHRVRSTHLHNGYAEVCNHNGVVLQANNDIAVMELLNLLVFSDTIQSVPLSIISRSSLYLQCDLVWLRNTCSPTIKEENLSLWWDNVAITTHEDCRRLYLDLHPNIRCLLNPFDTRSPAPGDSGAPVVCDDVLTALLTGGLSQGDYAAKVIMVAPYVNWIQKIIFL